MRQMKLNPEPLRAEQIPARLRERGILMNHYAEEYMAHPRFSTTHPDEMTVTIAALKEIGLENGGTLGAIFRHVSGSSLKPCPVSTGLFLRLAWTDQPQSQNSILSGTHQAPDQAVTVLSEILEENDAFPKGLYLRNVDGMLWLRGYTCDAAYCFPGDALFAFETVTETESIVKR